MYRILSIDGGGVRGILPAAILASLEEKAGKPCHELFDLIAGTSTGGLLALMLAKSNPLSAAQALEFYYSEAPRVFNDSYLQRRLPVLGALDSLYNPKYEDEGRIALVREVVGNQRMADALTDVLLTSYDIQLRMPVFFRRASSPFQPRNFRRLGGDIPMADAALATSAAPTYFAPHCLQSPTNGNAFWAVDSPFYCLIDGAVFANNPSIVAMAQAFSGARNSGIALRRSDILLVSLGTGSATESFAWESARDWGTMQWIRPIIDITLDGINESTDVVMDALFPEEEREQGNYYRFQSLLPQGREAIDRSDPEHLQWLADLSRREAHLNRGKISKLAQKLSGR